MVAVNYVRLDSDPQSGLHTLVARPALSDHTGQRVRVRQCCGRRSVRWRSGHAPPVRRLPAKFGLDQVRTLAQADRRQNVGAGGIAWAINELDLQPVYLNFAENAT